MKKTNSVLNHTYEIVKHKSGLNVILYPLEGYEGTHVQFGTHFGSVDMAFETDDTKGEYIPPYGVAHFLEHKMFEQEYGDAFERFGHTGANANAFTSFDRTCYLFHCTDKLYDSLEILLDFVSTPYFTKEGVDKEQGIIAQEIRQYEDQPSTKVFYNLLNCLYHNHPVKVDIIGTEESISHITPEVLNTCYDAFYNLNNMVLTVVGKFEREKVLALCGKILKPSKNNHLKRKAVEEPKSIVKKRTEAKFPVSMPMFEIGFKELPIPKDKLFKVRTQLDIILEYLAGHTSEFYNRLYKQGLINATFDYEVFDGDGYLSLLFGGESENPEEVYKLLVAEIARLKEKGLDKDNFDTVKRAIYGENIRSFENIGSLTDDLTTSHFTGEEIFDTIEQIKNITFEDTNNLFAQILDENNAAMSVVKGM